MVDGGNSGIFELLVACFIANDEIFRFSAFDGVGKDSIRVKIIEEEDVIVSKEGLERKLAREVCCNHSSKLGDEEFQRDCNRGDNVTLL